MSRERLLTVVAIGSGLLIAAPASAAKTAEQVFRDASPSVVVVRVSDHSGKIGATGSGVAVLEQGQVLTNCHVLKSRASISVGYRGAYFPAQLDVADYHLDLCGLIVPGLSAPPARIAPLRSVMIGARVFAIGTPKGLELSISDGIVAGIRQHQGKPVIQTTTPISPGSSGGGLFDDQGRLIGITTFFLIDGQNLNFAVPAELVVSLEKLSESQVLSFEDHRSRSFSQIAKVMSLIADNKYPAAIELATNWTREQPGNPFAWFFLGEALQKQALLSRAIDAYMKALEHAPRYAAAWVGLGDVYLSIGRVDLGRQAYEEALLADSRSSAAYMGLARTRLMKDDRFGALTLFERATRVSLESGIPDLDALFAFCGMASVLHHTQKENECRELSKVANDKLEGLMLKK
jgi:hypothetical protein